MIDMDVSRLETQDLFDAFEGHPKSNSFHFPPVLTKLDFVRRYEKNEFGNRSPTWNGLRDWERKHSGSLYDLEKRGVLYHIRNRIAGGPTYYNVKPTELFPTWMALIGAGVREDSLYISEMAPTSKTLIQGEIMETEKGISLYYSTLAFPMREALAKRSETVTGITALTYLRYYMNPLSYDWLEVLLERYKNHVVEFSTYGCEWGTLPGYNTVTWEVRMYQWLLPIISLLLLGAGYA